VTFFDYPQQHWTHLRTTNIVGIAVRSSTLKNRCIAPLQEDGERQAMIWKMLCVAEKSWRSLNAPHLMKQVYEGKRFKDGVAVQTRMEPTRKAA